jgi:serine/threonine-protein kinase RsbT
VTGNSAEQFQIRVPIREEADVVVARRHVRELGLDARLAEHAVEALATAVSEVARNIVVHARAGELLLGVVKAGGRCGVVVLARDEGPGIMNLEEAMQDGYTTAKGLGLGLSSARRLVDEFEIVSETGSSTGTTVTMKKWGS